jgi:hypothetical protein
LIKKIISIIGIILIITSIFGQPLIKGLINFDSHISGTIEEQLEQQNVTRMQEAITEGCLLGLMLGFGIFLVFTPGSIIPITLPMNIRIFIALIMAIIWAGYSIFYSLPGGAFVKSLLGVII